MCRSRQTLYGCRTGICGRRSAHFVVRSFNPHFFVYLGLHRSWLSCSRILLYIHRRQRQASPGCNTQHICLSRHSGWRRNLAGISIARARLRATLTRRLQNRCRRPRQECRSFCILDAAVLADFCGWKRSRRVHANNAQSASALVQRPHPTRPAASSKSPSLYLVSARPCF